MRQKEKGLLVHFPLYPLPLGLVVLLIGVGLGLVVLVVALLLRAAGFSLIAATTAVIALMQKWGI